MLAEEEKQQIYAELDQVRAKIKDIKIEISKINKEKEDWFSKKENYKQQILSQIGQVKELKHERDSLTSEVQLNKHERENIEKKIPELEKRLSDLTAQRDAMAAKLGVKKDYSTLKREIEMLSSKIETEPMSFNNEKKVMATIKEKKKELKNATLMKDISKQIKDIFSELSLYKNIRDISNSKVKNKAKTSRLKHLSMIEQSKVIDDLRAKEKEAFENFKKLKETIREKSELLGQEHNKLTELNKKLGIDTKENRQEEEKQRKMTLAEKRKEVELKLLRKEKLTTDDLLVMQSNM